MAKLRRDADNALFALALQVGPEELELPGQPSKHSLQDYACGIRTAAYPERPRNFGLLLKVRGYFDWTCRPGRLDISLIEVRPEFVYTRNVLDDLSQGAVRINGRRQEASVC